MKKIVKHIYSSMYQSQVNYTEKLIVTMLSISVFIGVLVLLFKFN